ncbi:MBOAT family protein [Bosea caraganae]|uniref:Probable alginate O-acetylase AlgI n=1 Tax=Bosea caraganae TaxID=2763117 RepID=A0A370LBH0_9HYPH|nr:MBOAT family O-acyltransferase [Bosea caraganae]RDJ27298.1 MBOAT family protein [Bosea caraganae]RDJ29314.1 MBOAT family protein [Bosea caraganae]
MLFNSFVFLLGFLPLALGLHWLVERFQPGWRLPLLAALSFAFYGYWDWRFIPLLAFSVLINWLIAEAFLRTKRAGLITLAIALNLAVLALFKYFNFFADLAGMIPGLPAPKLDLALPLGISFFTFHHVMYLTDLRRGEAPRYDLVRYALYIAFFPQVLAGPLVRWREIMHQFEERPYLRADAAERVARGLMLLTFGLAKKVLLGDPLAEYANPVFAAAAAGQAVSVAEAWQGVLAFTFQIYFDFSGYTDMALGLALLFGIVLPQNFDAPYRSLSIQDFWRRWHMTLSRFLRDYLYIPLGGSRHGLPMQVWALFATMALGGLWHGAGLTFIAWGAAHGLALIVALFWRRANLPMPAPLGWLLTFVFVMFCWVLFRAATFEAALVIYKAMLGFAPHGIGFKWRALLPAAAFAIIGPTSWALVHKLPPARWIAILTAILFVLVLFKIGDDANYEFIYFQF